MKYMFSLDLFESTMFNFKPFLLYTLLCFGFHVL